MTVAKAEAGRSARPRGRKAAAPRRSTPLTEDEVFERIYQAVLDHRVQPGTKLREVALAEVFGVSRSVVRNVLARLAYARLIVQTPNRGATVASPSVAESRDLFSARRAIEGAIVDALARRITPADAKRLRELAAQERAAYDRGDASRGLKMSLRFHRELASMAGNGVLAEMLDNLIARTPLVVLSFGARPNENLCSNHEHGDIVEAIASGNAAKAVAAMSVHLRNLEDQLDLSAAETPPTDLASVFMRG